MLMLEQVGLIDALMSSKAHVKVQLASLKCWQRILLMEEKRIDGGKAKAKMDSDRTITTAKRISGDQDSESTLFGGVLTNHAIRLFEMTQSRNREVRFAALEVLGSLLRQGQVNPNEATPYLLALQGDVEDFSIRKLALELITTEGEKRPDIIRQRVCAGVKRAYAFQRSIYPNRATVSALVDVSKGNAECVFSSVYKECVASSRKQRQGFFSSLLGLFERSEADEAEPKAHGSPKKTGAVGPDPIDLGLLSFVSQILAHLPYGYASDPLYIIHKINALVTLQGSEILEQFACLMRPVGLASSDEYDETNFTEDALERAARSKFPTQSHEAKDLSSGTFDIEFFEKLCRDGTCMVLLLRLKDFLRQLYSLSELRILEYDPSSKDRVAEKSVMKADVTKPFDSSIPTGACKRSGAANLDSLIRQYAEFVSSESESTYPLISLYAVGVSPFFFIPHQRRLMRELMNSAASLESRKGDEDISSDDDVPEAT